MLINRTTTNGFTNAQAAMLGRMTLLGSCVRYPQISQDTVESTLDRTTESLLINNRHQSKNDTQNLLEKLIT